MSKLPGYEETVVCPYNKCHIILKSRIQTHLVKCAKQHPEIKLETCPFDITHRYRPEEKNAHIESCPSRDNFDRYVYSIGTNNRSEQPSASQQKPQSRSAPKNDDDDEDWD